MMVFMNSLLGIAATLITACIAVSDEAPRTPVATHPNGSADRTSQTFQEHSGPGTGIWNDNGIWRYDGREGQDAAATEGSRCPERTPAEEQSDDFSPAHIVPPDERRTQDQYGPEIPLQGYGGLPGPYPYQDYFPYALPYYSFPQQSGEGYYGNPAIYSRDAYAAGYAEGFNSGKYDLIQGNIYNPRQYERSGHPDYFEGFVAGYQDGYRR